MNDALQLALPNVHFFITAIAYRTGLSIPKVHLLVVQDVEQAEGETPVEEIVVEELEVAAYFT
jgi:hypothetical protein